MHISFAEYSLELHEWQSKHQMISSLEDCEAGSCVLGENPDQESNFYSVVVHLGQSGLRRYGIGICSQGHGLVPHLLIQPEFLRLILGFNSDIVGIRIPDGRVDFSLHLDSLFYSFLPVYNKKVILVMHESGVVSLTQNGQMIWKFEKDIITRTTIEENYLWLTFMDALPVRLNLLNGAIE
ncbi:MAG: hypothetical protein JW850_01250 [Thermoflexales bacterium]|nr:hypothetical protein [Thermoflexales bacterium]